MEEELKYKWLFDEREIDAQLGFKREVANYPIIVDKREQSSHQINAILRGSNTLKILDYLTSSFNTFQKPDEPRTEQHQCKISWIELLRLRANVTGISAEEQQTVASLESSLAEKFLTPWAKRYGIEQPTDRIHHQSASSLLPVHGMMEACREEYQNNPALQAKLIKWMAEIKKRSMTHFDTDKQKEPEDVCCAMILAEKVGLLEQRTEAPNKQKQWALRQCVGILRDIDDYEFHTYLMFSKQLRSILAICKSYDIELPTAEMQYIVSAAESKIEHHVEQISNEASKKIALGDLKDVDADSDDFKAIRDYYLVITIVLDEFPDVKSAITAEQEMEERLAKIIEEAKEKYHATQIKTIAGKRNAILEKLESTDESGLEIVKTQASKWRSIIEQSNEDPLISKVVKVYVQQIIRKIEFEIAAAGRALNDQRSFEDQNLKVLRNRINNLGQIHSEYKCLMRYFQ